jgi:hypothetical protein
VLDNFNAEDAVVALRTRWRYGARQRAISNFTDENAARFAREVPLRILRDHCVRIFQVWE